MAEWSQIKEGILGTGMVAAGGHCPGLVTRLRKGVTPRVGWESRHPKEAGLGAAAEGAPGLSPVSEGRPGPLRGGTHRCGWARVGVL